jgi:SAM-dependent methyltransferase
MIDVAVPLGLEAFGTASAGKHDLARDLGGTPIDYQHEDFVARNRWYRWDPLTVRRLGSKHSMTNESAPVDSDLLIAEVRKHYAEVATSPDHDFHFHTGRVAALQVGYDPALIEDLSDALMASFAGVADPFYFGLPQRGETVLDVGSGAGVDVIIAGEAIGPEGRVIGVDMTPEMITKARDNAATAGLTNVEFREGRVERLPIEAGSVDLVISNGVLNLTTDKYRAYKQIFRALKPGGRIQIADICVDKPVSEKAKRDIDLWTG